MERGFAVLRKKLPDNLTAELLEWHQTNMKKAKGRVHTTSGARTFTWKGKPVSAQAGGLEFNDSSIKPRLEEAAKFIAGFVGRSPDSLMRHIHLLQFEHGQTQQKWHQDSPFPMLGVTVLLERSLATEFLAYEGRDLSQLYHPGAREAYMNEAWDLADSPEPKVHNKGRKLPAGSIIVFSTSHLHRAPPPPKQGQQSRKVIFFSFEADVADAGSSAIFSHNRTLSFPDARANVRKRTRAEVAPQSSTSADLASADLPEAATVDFYASLLTELSSSRRNAQ